MNLYRKQISDLINPVSLCSAVLTIHNSVLQSCHFSVSLVLLLFHLLEISLDCMWNDQRLCIQSVCMPQNSSALILYQDCHGFLNKCTDTCWDKSDVDLTSTTLSIYFIRLHCVNPLCLIVLVHDTEISPVYIRINGRFVHLRVDHLSRHFSDWQTLVAKCPQ